MRAVETISSNPLGFSVQQAAALLDLSVPELRSLLKVAEASEREDFSFQDLVVLRTAKGLVEQKVPARRIKSALLKLKEQLPTDKPLSGVVIAADGESIVVRDGQQRWNPESGQVLFDFDELARRAASAPALLDEETPERLYADAFDAEEEAPDRAMALYREVLRRNPKHADAQVNLGRLLHEAGDARLAESHYRQALLVRPNDAIATFNLGTALEDQSRIDEAIKAYVRAIELDPDCVDAYFNLARLYEKKGERAAAIRHLKDYQRLSGPRR
jgi:tetratricopeptide (TPR) repeat protein